MWGDSMTYTHRNGETDAPTIGGHYWFRGQVKKPGQKRGNRRYCVIHAFGVKAEADGRFFDFDCFSGQWWGPLVAPWGTE
jgi:hypothetical protein